MFSFLKLLPHTDLHSVLQTKSLLPEFFQGFCFLCNYDAKQVSNVFLTQWLSAITDHLPSLTTSLPFLFSLKLTYIASPITWEMPFTYVYSCRELPKFWVGDNTKTLWSEEIIGAKYKLCVQHGHLCYPNPCMFLVALGALNRAPETARFLLLPANDLKSGKGA